MGSTLACGVLIHFGNASRAYHVANLSMLSPLLLLYARKQFTVCELCAFECKDFDRDVTFIQVRQPQLGSGFCSYFGFCCASCLRLRLRRYRSSTIFIIAGMSVRACCIKAPGCPSGTVFFLGQRWLRSVGTCQPLQCVDCGNARTVYQLPILSMLSHLLPLYARKKFHSPNVKYSFFRLDFDENSSCVSKPCSFECKDFDREVIFIQVRQACFSRVGGLRFAFSFLPFGSLR